MECALVAIDLEIGSKFVIDKEFNRRETTLAQRIALSSISVLRASGYTRLFTRVRCTHMLYHPPLCQLALLCEEVGESDHQWWATVTASDVHDSM